jgi:hypothetical protein
MDNPSFIPLPPRSKRQAYVFLAIGCIIVLVYVNFNARGASGLPAAMESVLTATLFATGIYYWLFARHHRRLPVISGIVFFLVAIFGSIIGLGEQQHRFDETVRSVEKVVTGKSDTYEAPNSGGPLSSREAFMNLVGVYAAKNRASISSYEQAIAKIGVINLYDGPRLSKDRGMKESYTMLANLRAVYDDLHSSITARNQDFLARTRKLDLGSSEKENVERSMATDNILVEWLELEHKGIDVSTEIIDYLNKERRSWHIEDELIIFNNEKKQQKFEGYIYTLTELGEAGEKIKAAADAKIREGLKLLKRE